MGGGREVIGIEKGIERLMGRPRRRPPKLSQGPAHCKLDSCYKRTLHCRV